MGASASAPRRVTVENEDASGVIVMSDSVYSRLQSNMKGGAKKSGDESSSGTTSSPSTSTGALSPSTTQSEDSKASSSTQEHFPRKGEEVRSVPIASSSVPLVQYVQEPSLSALKVKEAKEEELRELEIHYQKRLNDLRDEHGRIANLTEDHFQESLTKIQSLFKAPLKGPICTSERQKVLECYNNNSEKPLVCSESVLAFQNCVRASRFTSG